MPAICCEKSKSCFIALPILPRSRGQSSGRGAMLAYTDTSAFASCLGHAGPPALLRQDVGIEAVAPEWRRHHHQLAHTSGCRTAVWSATPAAQRIAHDVGAVEFQNTDQRGNIVAISSTLNGRSMSAVRPWPCRSTAMTCRPWASAARSARTSRSRRGRQCSRTSGRPVPAIS